MYKAAILYANSRNETQFARCCCYPARASLPAEIDKRTCIHYTYDSTCCSQFDPNLISLFFSALQNRTSLGTAAVARVPTTQGRALGN